MKKLMIPTYLGSGLGFLAFLFLGAVPGLLYGGYMGLIMSGLLFGTPVAPTLAAKVMTFGGMALGLAAALSLFLVVGALLGTAVGAALQALTRQLAGTPASAKASELRP